MSRITYVNGEFLPEEEAKISIFDRGFLMADGVYEVTSVLNSRLIDFDGHIARLQNSLGKLGISFSINRDKILEIHRQLIEKNTLKNGLVYLQITRGPADRDFAYPAEPSPSLVMFTQEKELKNAPAAQIGIKVISIEDQRWQRCDIKTIQLLFPSMAKMAAKTAGVDDAWLVQDGLVTEGTSNNAYIIKDKIIFTRPISNKILSGITRAAVLRFADEAGYKVKEQAFSIPEAQAADEAFITSATTFVLPVIEIDGIKVGSGKVGPLAVRLREIYLEESQKRAI